MTRVGDSIHGRKEEFDMSNNGDIPERKPSQPDPKRERSPNVRDKLDPEKAIPLPDLSQR